MIFYHFFDIIRVKNPNPIEKNRKIELMTQVKIVTDSSVTIEPEVVKELNITIVPLSVMIDGVLYSDADLKEGEFLHLMQQSKNLPKTSQPPVGVFAEVFEELGKMAVRLLLFICLMPCLGLLKLHAKVQVSQVLM